MTTSAKRTVKVRSLGDANKMVPYLKSLSKSIEETWQSVIDTRNEYMEALNIFERKKATRQKIEISFQTSMEMLKEKIGRLVAKCNDLNQEAEDLGIYIEQYSNGSIKIPSYYNGKMVFLSYNHTEDLISRWFDFGEDSDHSSLIRNGDERAFTGVAVERGH